MPASVLQALKDAGIYEVNHLLPARGGFHKLDVETFSQRFLALSPDTGSPNITGVANISLRSVLCGRHDCTATNLSTVRALMKRGLLIVGSVNGTPGGLLLNCFT